MLWEVDPHAVDLEKDADFILARILEFGRLEEVRWALDHYGPGRILRFFREVGHPEISRRTVEFWRSFFRADGETWASPADFRTRSGAPWPG
jgi:hypothetical protein